MKIFGLCTTYSNISQLTYEQYAISSEAQKEYDRVLLIDPRFVNYMFFREQATPILLYQHENIASLTSLMVRSTKNVEAAVAILVRSLKICGCDVFDPIERFSVGKASKLLTTISRFKSGLGTSTYISFTRTGAQDLLQRLTHEGRLPLLTKPITGKKGQGVELINDIEAGLACIEQYFGSEEYLPDPFYFQDYVDFQKEYRLLIMDGESLGIIEKVKAPGKIAANAAQGGTFIKVEAPDITPIVLQNVSQEGILGVDVAIDQNGHLHIIETNRAPQWDVFERTTGINVAKIIIQRAAQRLTGIK